MTMKRYTAKLDLTVNGVNQYGGGQLTIHAGTQVGAIRVAQAAIDAMNAATPVAEAVYELGEVALIDDTPEWAQARPAVQRFATPDWARNR